MQRCSIMNDVQMLFIQSSIDKEFINWYEDLELNDLGYNGGPLFTWKREGCESRIDRVVVNSKFKEIFSDTHVKHLPWFQSDPRLILLSTTSVSPRYRRDRPFRIVASWILHDDFPRLVKESWDPGAQWEENVGRFTSEVGSWCHNVFG